MSAALDKLGDFPFKDPEEAHFDGPALFVRGTRSHYVADETLPLIGRFFPRFELRDIDSGHWVISEQPELFNHGMTNSSITSSFANRSKRSLSFFQGKICDGATIPFMLLSSVTRKDTFPHSYLSY